MRARTSIPPAIVETRFKGRKARLGKDSEEIGRFCTSLLRSAASGIGLDATHEISLLLCDSGTIRALNRKWRRREKPTDVLSFSAQELAPGEAPAPGALGDIVIAIPIVRRQARSLGSGFKDHLALIAIHGLLHLLGYDHQTLREARVMQKEEERLLGLLRRGRNRIGGGNG